MDRPFETQKIWGWQAVLYLFLAGVGSGCVLVGMVYGFWYEAPFVAKIGLIAGIPLVILGSLFLLLDIGRPIALYLSPGRPMDSWISKGFLILSAFIILGLIQIALWVWPGGLMGDFSNCWKIFGVVNGVLAIFTSLYPGVLLGCSPIPLWNTPMLPVVFWVSSLSTGAAAILLMLQMFGVDLSPGGLSFLIYSEAVLIVLEAMLLGLYLYGIKLVAAARASVREIVSGRWAGRFWVGLVGAGLVIPFLSVTVWKGELLSAVGVLVGGYILRDVVIRGGIKMPLMAQGVIIPIPGKS